MLDLNKALFKQNTTIVTGVIIAKNRARLLSGKEIKFFGNTSVYEIGSVAKFIEQDGSLVLLNIEKSGKQKTKTVYI